MLSIVFAATLLSGPDLSAYEGVARDNFAAWSFTSGQIEATAEFRRTSVLVFYNTPTAFNGVATPVAYSIHTVTFDCAEETAEYVDGTNYSQSGAVVPGATPSPPRHWTDFESGFQTLAQTVCAMEVPNAGV